MAKAPKKDINLYPLVVAPKKNTMKKGALFAVLGIAAVVLLGGGYAGARIYVHTQENLVEEIEAKTNDPTMMEKIANANAVAADINTLRTAGDAYANVRIIINGSQTYCNDFSDELIAQLFGCQTISGPGINEEQIAEITAISYDGQTLLLTANSPDSQDVSTFVTNLKKLDLFESVTYDSYALSEDTYGYTVSAVFKPMETTATDENGNVITETTTEVVQ